MKQGKTGGVILTYGAGVTETLEAVSDKIELNYRTVNFGESN